GKTSTYGGYSACTIVDENYVLRIPENIPLKRAAPLLCAGITTYSPLRQFSVKSGDKVAVVGLGGLGHLAVKFAKAMGTKVTVLSHSPGKREDALRLGADDFVITRHQEASRKTPDVLTSFGQEDGTRCPYERYSTRCLSRTTTTPTLIYYAATA